MKFINDFEQANTPAGLIGSGIGLGLMWALRGQPPRMPRSGSSTSAAIRFRRSRSRTRTRVRPRLGLKLRFARRRRQRYRPFRRWRIRV